MSHFTSMRGTFIHIYRKYGISSVKNHSFISLLKNRAKQSKDWFTVDKEIAEILVQLKGINDAVLCLEVDSDNRPEDELTEYVGVYKEDLDENLHFPKEWKTFVVDF